MAQNNLTFVCARTLQSLKKKPPNTSIYLNRSDPRLQLKPSFLYPHLFSLQCQLLSTWKEMLFGFKSLLLFVPCLFVKQEKF